MPARRASCLHVDGYVALTIKGTDITCVFAVVDDMQDVGRLGPTDTLQVNRELGADWPFRHVKRHCCRFDQMGTELLLCTIFNEKTMRAAEVVGRLDVEFKLPRCIGFGFRNFIGGFLIASPAHSAAGDMRPVELVSFARLEALAADLDRFANTGKMRG